MPQDPPFRVRAARPTDAPSLTLLLNTIIAAGGTTAMEAPLTVAGFADHFLTGPDVFSCVVAEGATDGALIGFQAVCRYPDLPADWGDIATFTRRAPRTPGVGTALFPLTVRAAGALALAALNAAIRADNAGGLAYYAKMGFVPYGRLEAVPLRDGTPVDRILERYDLA